MPLSSPYTTPSFNAKQTVGTTRAQLPATAAFEVHVTTDTANTGNVFIGDVTVTSSGGGNVFTVLPAGSNYIFSIADASKFYAVGSASGQVFYVGGLR